MRRRVFTRLALASAASLLALRPAFADDDPGATPSGVPSAAAADPLRSLGDDYQITIENGASLHGSLTLPSRSQPPVVLIVPGSGPIDRNGNTVGAGLSTDVYAELAAALATRGIATLRYDKRGVGESAGAVKSEMQVRFDDYIADANQWFGKLRDDRRFSSVSIAGHSEGSLIGMVAATTNNVEAFVSLEGAGRPLADMLREQLRPDLEATPNLIAESERILTALSRGETTNKVPAELSPIFRPSIQPYLISAFRYDPRQYIGKAGRRAAIIQGDADIQVPVADAKLLAAARPDATLTIIERMSHVLKLVTDPAPEAQIATVYANARLPLAPQVPDAIATSVIG